MLRAQAAAGRKCIVLDPKNTTWAGAALVETSADRMLRICKASRGLFVVLDEVGQALDRYAVAHHWFATMSREWGHTCVFIGQRGAQMHPNIRENVYQVALFKASEKQASVWAEEFANPELAQAHLLERYWFYWCDRFKGCVKKAPIGT